MSILSIKSDFLLPEKELILNKSLILNQRPALIASITEQAGVIKLWIFQQMPNLPIPDISREQLPECKTKRDEICRHASQYRINFPYFSEITIQGIKLLTSSVHYIIIESNSTTALMKLQHFIEAGVDFSSIENVSFGELVLSEYELSKETVFPEINTGAEMPVTLKIGEEFCTVLVEPPHCFNIKVGEQDISRSFVDPSTGKEIVYYITELVCYDIWKETMDQFQDEEFIRKLLENGHDEVSIEKMKADAPGFLESVCPKGHALLILMYECTEDINLNFYTNEFLLDALKHDGSYSSSSATSFAILSFGKESRFGNQVQSCALNAVPISFDDTIEIELMTWRKKIPEETVNLL